MNALHYFSKNYHTYYSGLKYFINSDYFITLFYYSLSSAMFNKTFNETINLYYIIVGLEFGGFCVAKFWLYFARGCMGTVVSPVITSVQHITTGGVVRRIRCQDDIGRFNGDKRHPFFPSTSCANTGNDLLSDVNRQTGKLRVRAEAAAKRTNFLTRYTRLRNAHCQWRGAGDRGRLPSYLNHIRRTNRLDLL